MMTNVDDFWERERDNNNQKLRIIEEKIFYYKNNDKKNISNIYKLTVIAKERMNETNIYVYGFVLEMTNIDE